MNPNTPTSYYTQEDNQRLDGLIKEALRIIQAPASYGLSKPVILWSGGKDSMVLLHIIRALTGANIPLICWREPWHPKKNAFTNAVIKAWNLEVYDWAPSKVALCEGNGRIDVLNYYQTGPMSNPSYLILARGTEEEEHPDQICGLDTFFRRPLGSCDFPWDTMYHGHKSSDEDPTSGPVPLSSDMVIRPNAGSAFYPLRNWTDRDIFHYIEVMGVPYDSSRYQNNEDGTWTILPDKTLNPDYFYTCWKCVKKDGGPVICPKTNSEMGNLNHAVPWEQPSAPYCGLRS